MRDIYHFQEHKRDDWAIWKNYKRFAVGQNGVGWSHTLEFVEYAKKVSSLFVKLKTGRT